MIGGMHATWRMKLKDLFQATMSSTTTTRQNLRSEHIKIRFVGYFERLKEVTTTAISVVTL
jgi:hypothetical protein